MHELLAASWSSISSAVRVIGEINSRSEPGDGRVVPLVANLLETLDSAEAA
jgi:hypothetical protein